MSSDGYCVGMRKFLAFLSFIAFCLHAVGIGNPYWIEKEFTFPPPAIAAGMGIPQTKVESNIGVLWACTDRTIMAPVLNETTDSKCESLADIDADLVENWQWIAAGLGIGALVVAFISLILACCLARRGLRDTGLTIGVIICYILACGMILGSIVIFKENKEIPITPLLPLKEDYDFAWGFFVAVGSASLLLLLALLNMAVPCCSSSDYTV